MNTMIAKQLQTVLKSEFESGNAKVAYAALDMAHDLDRLFEEVQNKASYLADKAARYSQSLQESRRMDSMDNPISYPTLIMDLCKAQGSYEATHRALRAMLASTFGREVMVAAMTQEGK